MSSTTTTTTKIIKTTKEEKKDHFQLSFALGGHKKAVRDVGVYDDNLLGICVENGWMRVWQRKDGSREFFQKNVLEERVHQSLAFCVAPARSSSYPSGTFISGGGDKTARPWTANGELLEPLIGHTNCVNSISFTPEGLTITGAWDGTVIVWNQIEPQQVLHGHQHAVEVLGLSTGEIITGSTNKKIIIFNEGQAIKTINNAHDHAIKKLIPHSLGFASCGNDGYVKVWSNRGELLQTIASHINDEPKFVYGLVCLPSGQLATSGEDGTVRIWSLDGASVVQSIHHPGAVRSLKCLPNGDLVTACADRVARIFTKDPSRIASDLELRQFSNLADLVKASKNHKQMDVSKLPTETALLQPGKKNGEVKIVNIKGKAIVYKWTANKFLWEKFGEAIAQGPKSTKTFINGIGYDHVTDVHVTDERIERLGFNRDDDPMEVPHNFCAIHAIPPDLRQQIIDHITPMVDENLNKIKKMNEKGIKEATRLRHVPAWQTGGFHINGDCKPQKIKSKIMQFNDVFKEAGDPNALNDKEMKIFSSINLEDRATYHSALFPDEQAKVMYKLLRWPTEKIIPVLDCYRVLMCHVNAVQKLDNISEVQQEVLKHATSAGVEQYNKNLLLVLRALTNWVAKRTPSRSEKQQSPSIPGSIIEYLTEALDRVAFAATSDAKNLRLAYTMFVHNVISWHGRLKISDSDFYYMVSGALCETLAPNVKQKTFFYGLLTLGSIGFINDTTKKSICDVFGEQLKTFARKGKQSKNKAIQEVSEDLIRVYGFTGL